MANHILKANRFKNPGQKTRLAIETKQKKDFKQVKMLMKALSSL